ncbi:MAG: type II toxin-antitoxin system Phd/YefM family antitoxin [Pseudomonadota bacterium]
MSEEWQVQEAKAKFSEFLDAALSRGPQVVTKRGVPTAVLVPIDEWRRLQAGSKPSLKDLLLDSGPRTEALVPERSGHTRRAVPLLD